MSILLSFLNLCLYIAIICLIAYVILWVIQGFFGWAIDANVLRFGKIVVGLLCLIAVVAWLAGAGWRSRPAVVLATLRTGWR